jgi:DNA-binding HxlR family transcriptional regulator
MSRKARQNVRVGILKRLKESSRKLTYTELQQKLSTNYDSVKENCDELENYGLIKVERKKEHPRNNHDYFEVSLTEAGQKTKTEEKKF